MIKADTKFMAIYMAIIVIVILRIVSNLFPEYGLWALSHNFFVSSRLNIFLAVLMLIGLSIPFIKRESEFGFDIAISFNNMFYQDDAKYFYRAIFTAVLTIVFILFLTPTHFLGDGYTVLANIASDTGTFLKWSEKGITIILASIQSVIGEKSEQTALVAFQIVSVFSGIISIWFYFLLTEVLSENKTKRILLFVSLLLSGTILLFFGYVENYPLLQPTMLGFLYYGIKYIAWANRRCCFGASG